MSAIIAAIVLGVIIIILVKAYYKDDPPPNQGQPPYRPSYQPIYCHSHQPIYRTAYQPVLIDKGKQGEMRVINILNSISNGHTRILTNLYIPYGNGDTTEIDILFISQSGFFVLESKNYAGWIFGEADQRYWCQTIASHNGVKKNKFYNPILQNQTHIQCLKKLFHNNIPCYSAVIFADDCSFKDISLKNTDAFLMHQWQLAPFIQDIQNRKGVLLSDEEITKIYNYLLPFSYPNEVIKRRHLQRVQEKQQFYQQ